MNSFIWKNQDSYRDYGIIINKLPSIVKAEKNVEEIEIPGRSGDLTIDYNSYKPIVFSMACTVLDRSQIDDIKAWLDGYDELIFSCQDDRHYKAKMISKIDINQSIIAIGEFQLLWKCQPFAYANYNETVELTVSNSKVFNLGNYFSEPIIKVYGTGSITLTINDKDIELTNVADYVTINTEIMNCYKDNDPKNNDMSGDFPTLAVGINTIAWTGTVTKVEITPNWRWL